MNIKQKKIKIEPQHTLGEKSMGSRPLQSNATIVLNLLLSSAYQNNKCIVMKN